MVAKAVLWLWAGRSLCCVVLPAGNCGGTGDQKQRFIMQAQLPYVTAVVVIDAAVVLKSDPAPFTHKHHAERVAS